MGQTYLQAQGGQRKCPTTKAKVPMYLWACRACGARWQRIPADAPQGSVPHQGGAALQPTPTPSSGLKTRVKRESKAKELPAQVDEVMIHSDQDEFEVSLLETL